MSEEVETEDEYTMLEVPSETAFHRNLVEITGGDDRLIYSRLNGDQLGTLGVKQRFESNDDIREFFKDGYPDEEVLLDDDEESVQRWTYVADYTIHSLTPGCDQFEYFIHARINKNYELEFAAFTDIIDTVDNERKETYILAEIPDSSGTWQKIEGVQNRLLKIASKEEAEKVMLNGGKIKVSSLPQYAGFLVNKSNARYLHGRITKGLRCYGHIWSYWYTIIDNTLYFIGFPLWTGETSGHILTTVSYPVPVPPTEYDRSYGIGNSEFRDAMSLVESIWYQDGVEGENDEVSPGAARILKKYGDWTTPTNVLQVVLAKYDSESKQLQQYHRGDIVNCLSSQSILGGVYVIDGKYKALSGTDFNFKNDEVAFYYKRGNSGFMPQKTRAVQQGKGYVFLYEMFPTIYGNSLRIQMGGPMMIYTDGWGSDEYDFNIPFSNVNPEPNPDPEDPEEEDPGPNPPTPWPSPGPNPSPNPPQPTPPSPIWPAAGGFIWVAGKGIDIKGKELANPKNGPVEIEFKITVNKKPKRVGTLNYETTLNVNASGGGAYALPPRMGGGAAYLSYGVDGESDISVRNASTYLNERVSPSGTFTKNLKLTWHASATFGSVTKTNWDSSLNSNFLTVTNTGKTIKKRMLVNKGKPNEFEVEASFTELRVDLNEEAVNQIIKNNTIKKLGNQVNARMSPSSIRGSVSGGNTAPPLLCASLIGSPTRPTENAGVAEPLGEMSMTITDQKIDSGKLEFKVTNSTKEWEEAGGRHSASIAGAFKVTTAAKNL